MAGTQKVLSTGRFGSRYGVGIRRKLLKIEPSQFQRHKCPNCGFRKVKRKSKGVFHCAKCNHEFVGGSYLPQTLTGGIISKMVMQKMFSPELVESLSKVREGSKAEEAAGENAEGGN
ncbi:MAG: 50S ribosomal protein L37ae [Candidatus Diapherotrites archaeon]|uniref:Large ribosomal subunit protein eL43 n=1 Tax=Candidatus Iainarchaeum sp. TaxID=3101447 RepID=A0A8T3YN30_9ARCH|nr:50S ribosomal protein L37ae [Candidatus Diapherotrites archaeon]